MGGRRKSTVAPRAPSRWSWQFLAGAAGQAGAQRGGDFFCVVLEHQTMSGRCSSTIACALLAGAPLNLIDVAVDRSSHRQTLCREGGLRAAGEAARRGRVRAQGWPHRCRRRAHGGGARASAGGTRWRVFIWPARAESATTFQSEQRSGFFLRTRAAGKTAASRSGAYRTWARKSWIPSRRWREALSAPRSERRSTPCRGGQGTAGARLQRDAENAAASPSRSREYPVIRRGALALPDTSTSYPLPTSTARISRFDDSIPPPSSHTPASR